MFEAGRTHTWTGHSTLQMFSLSMAPEIQREYARQFLEKLLAIITEWNIHVSCMTLPDTQCCDQTRECDSPYMEPPKIL